MIQSFADLFLRVEPKLRAWENLTAEYGDLDVIRLPSIPPVETRCVDGQEMAIYDADRRPIPLTEHRKPTHLFVGRLGMTLIAENYRPNQSVVSYDGTSFFVVWLRVVYVPWAGPDDVVVGTEDDAPQKPSEMPARLVDMAEARRRYDHG